MTKREAYERIDQGDLTWGHLKHYIEQCVDHGWGATSAVNPSITRRQALDILYAAIAPNEDNELIVSPRYTQARNSRNSLMAVNVLCETHWRVAKPLKLEVSKEWIEKMAALEEQHESVEAGAGTRSIWAERMRCRDCAAWAPTDGDPVTGRCHSEVAHWHGASFNTFAEWGCRDWMAKCSECGEAVLRCSCATKQETTDVGYGHGV